METRKWMPGGLASCAFSPQAKRIGMQGELPEVAVDTGCCQHYSAHAGRGCRVISVEGESSETPVPVKMGQKMQSFELLIISCRLLPVWAQSLRVTFIEFTPLLKLHFS